MEDTFPKDAGLGKLIGFCQENRDLQYLVEDLKAEKAKVEKQKKGKNKTAVEGRQGEPSSAHGFCSRNAPSSEEEQTVGTESGKKRKLNQEQTQPLEPSGSNTQKDEGCLQTSQKPATASSNSSNKKQKTTNTKQQSTLKIDDSQKNHQLLGLSATSNSSAAWEGQTLQGLAATASSSLNTTQTFPETCDSLKTSQGSPEPPSRSFLISPVSDTSIHLNSLMSAQTPYLPSSTASSNVLESLPAPPTTSKCPLAPMMSSATTSSSSYETPRRGNIPKEPAKEEGYHREPKEVMVLKVTEPFTYDLIDDKRMFHATVATENEFYRVKIFDPDLKNKFIPNKIIAISNYFGSSGFLEIHKSSCVSDVDKNRTMDISKTLRKRANATPKIRDLFSQAQGTYVNGEFVVYKKTERSPIIYYVIEDDTGKMEVVVHGRLTNIKCEPGQKLRLICFELSSSTDTWQLKSVRHSNMQVVNVRKKATLA
ncbi:interferon-activable protein 203-like isoform X2 [Microtus pennsylvanicus]